MLFRMIRIDTPAKLDSVLNVVERKRWSDLFHEIVIGVDGRARFEGGFTRVARLGGLTSLQLSDAENEGGHFSLHAPILLPDLQSLIATYNTLLNLPALLDPDVVPSLRHLAIRDLYGASHWSNFEESKFSELVPQLDSVHLPWRLHQYAPLYIQNRLDRVLFESFRFDLIHLIPAQPSVRHLRVIEGTYGRHLDPLHQLKEFVTWIESPAQTTLRSLYLDATLEHKSELGGALAGLVDTLLAACEAKKVEVTFEDQPNDDGFGAYFSDEFCKRQRVQMRFEAAKTAYVAKGTSY